MTSARPGVQLAVSAEPSAVFAFFQQTAAIAEIELKKLIRDPTEVLARAVQPVLWIVVFGNVFSRIRAIPTGNVSYLAFMTPGILAQSVLFVAIFYGIAVIWERDLGIVHKLLVSPAQRAALVYGKATSAGFRGAVQATIIYVVAFLLHIQIRWTLLSIAGVFVGAMLGSAIFATMSFIVACIVKSRERFMGVGQLMTISDFDHAALAARGRLPESFDLPGGCAAHADDRGQPKLPRRAHRFRHHRPDFCNPRRHRHKTLSFAGAVTALSQTMLPSRV